MSSVRFTHYLHRGTNASAEQNASAVLTSGMLLPGQAGMGARDGTKPRLRQLVPFPLMLLNHAPFPLSLQKRKEKKKGKRKEKRRRKKAEKGEGCTANRRSRRKGGRLECWGGCWEVKSAISLRAC
eukprot:3095812-Rhodomonas_salina.1